MKETIERQKTRGGIPHDHRELDEIELEEEMAGEAVAAESESLRRGKVLGFDRGGFSLPPGTDRPLPLGRLFVCPVDPSHYAVREREVGESLVCPEHHVPLRAA